MTVRVFEATTDLDLDSDERRLYRFQYNISDISKTVSSDFIIKYLSILVVYKYYNF